MFLNMESLSRSPLAPEVWDLPPGRHGLGRDLVTGSQRQRLLYAITTATAELGYTATTVADVLSRAGVSRKTFYEHFKDKLDCYLAASDVGREALICGVRAVAADVASRHADDPVAQLRAVVRAYLSFVASEPAFARAFFIEVVAAGPVAQERRLECRGDMRDLLRAWHDGPAAVLPEHRAVPDSAYVAAVAAADALICDHLRDHGAVDLLTVEGDVAFAFLAMLGMPEAASGVLP